MRPTPLLIASIASFSLTACADFFRADEQTQARGNTSPVAYQQTSEAPRLAVGEQLMRKVQRQLQAKGIEPGPIDGLWGPRTHQAIQEFQKAHGLDANGHLNAATLQALGILDGAQTASAQRESESASSGGTRMFERVDKNDDGAVSREEFNDTLGAPRSGAERSAGKPTFANLDANDDGYVTLAEAGADTRISRDLNRADLDGDGRLDRKEFQAALEIKPSGKASQ